LFCYKVSTEASDEVGLFPFILWENFFCYEEAKVKWLHGSKSASKIKQDMLQLLEAENFFFPG
jgi:hypothetical protein